MKHYYNEIDPYCCKVLRARIADGSLPDGYVDERDIREVKPADLAGYTQCHFFAGIGGFPLGLKWAGADSIDGLWTGGFPCQDISTANHRGRGLDGAKSGLWAEFYRLIRDVRPGCLIVENVSNLLNRGASRVFGDLAAIRYDAEWEMFPACAFGADIIRERLFICAQPEPQRRAGVLRGGLGFGYTAHPAWGPPNSLDTPDDRAERIEAWLREPAILGSLDGVPSKLVELQLGAYGNAIVPQIAEFIGRGLLQSASEVTV